MQKLEPYTGRIWIYHFFFVPLHRNSRGMSKKIDYIMPINWIRGNISGAQSITYDGVRAYELSTTDKVSADYYRPTLVAKYMGARDKRYYQVRTVSSVHLSAAYRKNLAVMGGAGAIYAAMVNNGSNAQRYIAMPALMDMLRNGDTSAQVAGTSIDNPWKVQNPNVPISPAILTKFNILS